MRIIKKLGAIALAATMMMSSVFSVPVQAATPNINENVTLNGTVLSYSAVGNKSLVYTSISYTAGTGYVSAKMTTYEYNTDDPDEIVKTYKSSGNMTTPGGASVSRKAATSYSLYHVEAVLSYDVIASGKAYDGNIYIDEPIS